MKTLIEAKGRVEWWFYLVSHGQLLLRRPKGSAQPRRLDILFKDVVEVRVVSFFDNLQVVEAGSEIATINPVGEHSIYRLVGDNAIGYIVAGAVVWSEDDGEYNEASSLTNLNT